MNTTHTPGPWRYMATPASSYTDWGVKIGRDTIGVYVEADARLIASAPDLLELVEAFATFLRDDSRSERRRAQCLAECESVLARAKVTS